MGDAQALIQTYRDKIAEYDQQMEEIKSKREGVVKEETILNKACKAAEHGLDASKKKLTEERQEAIKNMDEVRTTN